MSNVKTSKGSIAKSILDAMSREELTATAKAAGIKVGKSKADTVKNIMTEADKGRDGRAQLKLSFSLSFKPADDSAQRITFLAKRFRTYVSGPGMGDETIVTPTNPIHGSAE